MTEINTHHIRQLLFSSDIVFEEVGVTQLLVRFPETTSLAVEYLMACKDDRLKSFSRNLRRYLPFLRPCFSPQKKDRKTPYLLFDNIRMNMDAFLNSLYSFMKDCPKNTQKKSLQRLSEFPGIVSEIRKMVELLWSERMAQTFETYVNQSLSESTERQLMIFLSYTCNLQCPYCFSNNLKEPDISFHEVGKILDWAYENGVTRITFCGGEPSIYSEFPKVLDDLRSRGMRTYFATNLLVGSGVLEKLKPDIVDSLIVHVSHLSTYKGKQWSVFKQNIATVIQQGVPISMRINIYAEDHDWTHMFELAEEQDIKDVQIALTFPNSERNNQYVAIETFKELITSVIQLMEKCDQKGLRTAFSKPIPLCLFPDFMRNNLLQQSEYPPSCSIFMDDFTHNVCISPGKNVFPCMALPNMSKPLSQFDNWNEMAAFCRSEILPLMLKPVREQCKDCFLGDRRICQGSCLGHKI